MTQLTRLELELMKVKQTPIFKQRDARKFSIDAQLSNQLANTLNKIKGRIDSQIAQNGDLDVNEFIKFRVNRRAKAIPSFDIFNQEKEVLGLDIMLLIDCSGSMRGIDQELRNITATIMHSLKKCTFINFQVLAFSAKSHQYQSVIDKITKIDDCARVQADENDYHDIQNLAIDHAVKVLEKSENKKLILLITDGYPEAVYKEQRVDSMTMQSLMERSVINANNKHIPVFCLFYGHIPSVSAKMRKIFKGMLYESEDFNDIKTKLVKELIKAVEKLNQGTV